MKKLFKKKINIFKLLKKFFRKIINNFRLSHLLLKRETKKLVFLCIAFLITCMTTIIVSSMSLHLGNLLSIDDTVENKVVTFRKNDLHQGVLDYATTFTDNTIVKQSNINIKNLKVNRFEFDFIFSNGKKDSLTSEFFKVIDTRYDTFDKYDEVNKGKTPLPNSDELTMIYPIDAPSLGPATFEFEYEGIKYSKEVNIVDHRTSVGYISQSLYDYINSIVADLYLDYTSYSFSFNTVIEAVNFYNEIVKIDLALQDIVNFSGAVLNGIITNIKQASLIICVLALVVFITLIVCFLNILIILFIDKQKNIGLLKAQGLTNFRIANALLFRILVLLAICAVMSTIGSYLLMPVISNVFNSVFMGQFISNLTIVINASYAIYTPIAAFIIIIIPCIIYLAVKCKTSAITLIKG